jgi:hypothetical protein
MKVRSRSRVERMSITRVVGVGGILDGEDEVRWRDC